MLRVSDKATTSIVERNRCPGSLLPFRICFPGGSRRTLRIPYRLIALGLNRRIEEAINRPMQDSASAQQLLFTPKLRRTVSSSERGQGTATGVPARIF
jgi:hypothetical protein